MHAFVLSSVRAQVDAVLSEIARIEGSEFPYQHSQDALAETKGVFETHKESLASLSDKSDPSTVDLACNAASMDLRVSIDLLGFLLRSTSVRNAFEAYGPLLRITRQLLGRESKLIISSEWCFSPFTYLGYHYLPGVVLIGLPAPESSNPFLLPLSGHELGHSIWSHSGLARQMELAVEKVVITEIRRRWNENDFRKFFHDHKLNEVDTDLLARTMWKPAWDWALRQCEEHFCDFIGLRIFGESYLYAFAYLLAPQRQGMRPLIYPNLKTRAQSLAKAAAAYRIVVPTGYTDVFRNLQEPRPEFQRESLLLSLADAARVQFVDELQSKADNIILAAGLALPSMDRVDAGSKQLSLMVPCVQSKGLPNILNAAWKGWLDPNFFRDVEHNNRRLENLHEIVLKSVEVLEIEMKLEE